MTEQIKKASKNTKRAIENAYEVIAIAASIAAASKVATLPHVNNMAIWQIVAGVLLAGVAYRIFSLLNKEV